MILQFPSQDFAAFDAFLASQVAEFVIKTVPLGGGSSYTALFPKNPLRQVVARTPISVELDEARSTLWFLESLQCGHQIYVPLDWEWDEKAHMVERPPSAKRHRCHACGEAQLALKFPARKEAA
jgi:hypothetical protein